MGVAIITVAGFVASSIHWPIPCASNKIEVVAQGKVVFVVIISVFGLKLAASNRCPVV